MAGTLLTYTLPCYCRNAVNAALTAAQPTLQAMQVMRGLSECWAASGLGGKGEVTAQYRPVMVSAASLLSKPHCMALG